MPLLPPSELERLKSELDLASVIRESGVELVPRGQDLVGHCPFHDDSDPSFVVTPSKGLWHCFGCSAGGSVFDYVMQSQKLDFAGALRLLAPVHVALTHSEQNSTSRVNSRNSVNASDSGDESPFPGDACPFDQDMSHAELLLATRGHYHKSLLADSAAHEYLSRRGLWDLGLVERFHLGYANRSLGLTLPPKILVKGRKIREGLTACGVLKESGHEHFRGCLMVPIHDMQGQIVQMYGRRTAEKLGAKTSKHLYLPSPLAGVWNAQSLVEDSPDTVYLCESLIDALTMVLHGFESTTTLYGTQGGAKEMQEFLGSVPAQKLVLCFDGDAAGQRATEQWRTIGVSLGLEVFALGLPTGQDVNSFACQSADPRAALWELVRCAKCLVKLNPAYLVAWESNSHVPPQLAPVVAEGIKGETLGLKIASKLEASDASSNDWRAHLGHRTAQGAHYFQLGLRHYRVLGLAQNKSPAALRVCLRVEKHNEGRGDVLGWHLDTLDLYSSKARKAYAMASALELSLDTEILYSDLAKITSALESLRDAEEQVPLEDQPVILDETQKAQALELLAREDLLDVLLADLESLGVVGERDAKLTTFLCLISRQLSSPLGLVVQSSSAAGKSTLLDAVLSLMPPEAVHRFSALSGQSLYYVDGGRLRHKILALSEDGGLRGAAYALKLLQSEGSLTMASTGKDSKTGRLSTQSYRTEGPVAVALTTTSVDLDPELMNRCLVLEVDESQAQTERIQALQRHMRTRAGQIQKAQSAALILKWQNALRMLRPVSIVNPHVSELRFVAGRARNRRDQAKFLSLTDAVAHLFQYQRPVKSDAYGQYIEVEPRDVKLAFELCRRPLAPSREDLPPQSRMALQRLRSALLQKAKIEGLELRQIRFSRRDFREWTGVGVTQARVHLGRLIETEWLRLASAPKGNQGQGNPTGHTEYYRLVHLEDPMDELPVELPPALLALLAQNSAQNLAEIPNLAVRFQPGGGADGGVAGYQTANLGHLQPSINHRDIDQNSRGGGGGGSIRTSNQFSNTFPSTVLQDLNASSALQSRHRSMVMEYVS
jgi:DNA primase